MGTEKSNRRFEGSVARVVLVAFLVMSLSLAPVLTAQTRIDLTRQAKSGTANQVVSANTAGTALEHRTLSVGSTGTDFAIAFGTGSIVWNLPSASATARGVVTTGTQTFAGAKTFTGLTSIAPGTGMPLTITPSSSGLTQFNNGIRTNRSSALTTHYGIFGNWLGATSILAVIEGGSTYGSTLFFASNDGSTATEVGRFQGITEFQSAFDIALRGVGTANRIKLTGSPTAVRTVTFPDASFTVPGLGLANSWGATQTAPLWATTSNCADGAGAAACGSASAGGVVIDAGQTSVIVSTTAVTANSQVVVMEDSSLGTRLSATCNTTLGRTYAVTARTAATSFTITASAAPSTNPACLSFLIIN